MSKPSPGHPENRGPRFELNTPALVLDLDSLERNIATMASLARDLGMSLRPHAKSHKCSKIARMQMEAGASGVCCATLDEAETMAAAGIPDILITSPITTRSKIERLAVLLRQAPKTMLVADHPANVALLGATARNAGVTFRLLVDVELGFGRTGVLTVEDAVEVAQAIQREEALSFAGVQAYGGHFQHERDHLTRLTAARAAGEFVKSIVARLAETGMPPSIVTGGGTGTHLIDGQLGVFTENQAGSYVFMDAQYETVAYGDGKNWPFANALFVQTAVISGNIAGSVTTDGGTKAFALNGPPPRIVHSAWAGAEYRYTGDEHGRVIFKPGIAPPAVGDRLECVVSHCDPTVVLYDAYHCVRGNALVDVWPIDARGRKVHSTSHESPRAAS